MKVMSNEGNKSTVGVKKINSQLSYPHQQLIKVLTRIFQIRFH